MGVPHSILNPNQDVIGVQYKEATASTPPMRIYYPATTESAARCQPVRWFQDAAGSAIRYLQGLGHIGLVHHKSWLFQILVRPSLHLVSLFLPIAWLRIPGVYENATPWASQTKLPLIVFSHGLTGTGQENAVLCAAWAKKGYVVASVHHTDGSSCQVRLADGTDKFYEVVQPVVRYEDSVRDGQIQIRAQDCRQAYEYLVQSSWHVDPQRAIAAGFSYGGATVARTVVEEQSPFMAAIFLDPWFHVNILEYSIGRVDFPASLNQTGDWAFPREAFARVQKDKSLAVPSLFLMSEQFERKPTLWKAAQELAGDDTTVQVLPGTGHQNFTDMIFWVQPLSLVRVVAQGWLGPADAIRTYQEIIHRTGQFLDNVTSVRVAEAQ